MQKLHLKFLTPERTLLDTQVDSLTVMTQNGEVTILPNHVPLVSNMRAGELHYVIDGETHLFAASTGLLHVDANNTAIVLADTADPADELDAAKIEEAKALAQDLLARARAGEDIDFADAMANIERELARERVAQKGKYRKLPTKPPTKS